jgi:hypothetical protein
LHLTDLTTPGEDAESERKKDRERGRERGGEKVRKRES